MRSFMALTGSQMQALQKALLAAFPRHNDLEQMIAFHLGDHVLQRLHSSNEAEFVFDLIRWIDSHDQLAHLLAGALAENPTNRDLLQVADQFDLSAQLSPRLLEESRKSELVADVSERSEFPNDHMNPFEYG